MSRAENLSAKRVGSLRSFWLVPNSYCRYLPRRRTKSSYELCLANLILREIGIAERDEVNAAYHRCIYCLSLTPKHTTMRLLDGATTDFLLIDERHTGLQVNELLRASGATNVVARVNQEQGLWWRADELSELLFSGANSPLLHALKRLSTGAPNEASASETQEDVEELTASSLHVLVPLVDGDLPIDAVPAQCIAIDGDVIAGIWDADDPAFAARRRAGDVTAGSRHVRGEPINVPFADVQSGACVLSVDFPSRLAVGEQRSMLVRLVQSTVEDSSFGSASNDTFDVVVQPIANVEIVGSCELQMRVATSDNSPPIRFLTLAKNAGTARIRVFVFRGGEAVAQLTVAAQVTNDGPTSSTRTQVALQAQTEREFGHGNDLTMLVLEQKTPPSYTIFLNAADASHKVNFMKFGPIPVEQNPQQLFDDFFADFEALADASTRTSSHIELHLAQRGSWLLETVFPRDLRELVWTLRTRIKTVLIQSDEPYIPWELCKLQGLEDGTIVEGPFFCEAFQLTRWMPGVPRRSNLTLDCMAVVAPVDSGLRATEEETEFLRSQNGKQRRVEGLNADYASIIGAFANAQYDGFHFAGHGAFGGSAGRSEIELDAGLCLRSTDISGSARNLGKRKPLIFLNSCQSGRAGLSLTNVGGWSAQFLRAGAGAFVGTYWSVFDDGAALFSRTFYQGLFDGLSISESTQLARAAVKATGDPSYLAYTVFAEPGATVDVINDRDAGLINDESN